MDKSTAKTLMYLALGAGALYLLYKFWNAGKALTAPVANALADAYVWLTSNGYAVPQGSVLLPDGRTFVQVAAIPGGIQPVSGSNAATFVYGGARYYLNTPSDSNGNWAASTTLAGGMV